ncbi:MAG: hypothetical protein HC855_09220 [Rhizobiales bacterium]|nr:hypothetical protein [Hyphomicrobiales bacterium]
MATLAEKIMLSLDLYEDASRLPPGWTRVAQRDDGGSGFFAAAYRKGGEIVVTFRGWNDAEPTDAIDILRAYENGPFEQIGDAQRFFDSVKAANPGATFSFTGHSLGGGLAAAMAVRNNLQATSFAAIEMVDAALESMNGHKEKFLGITLWEIAAATFNTAITRAELSNYAGVQNYTVFGDIAHYNDRATPRYRFRRRRHRTSARPRGADLRKRQPVRPLGWKHRRYLVLAGSGQHGRHAFLRRLRGPASFARLHRAAAAFRFRYGKSHGGASAPRASTHQ